MSRFVVSIGLAVLLLTATGPAMAQNVMITTHVENFEYVGGNIGCPRGGGQSAFAIDLGRLLGRMPERQAEQLLELIRQFEAENGVSVRSGSRTRDMTLESDRVSTSTEGPATGVGAQICDLVRPFV